MGGKFEKGRPKTGGRVKGVKSRRATIFDSLENIQTAEGDPVDIVKLFFNDMMSLPAMQRAEMWLRFMEFIYPKQRNLELSSGEEGFRVIIEDYTSK